MQIERPRKSRQMENTIALINIVFLILVFFMIAGTIAPASAPMVKAITTIDAEATSHSTMLGVNVEGVLIYQGQEISAQAYVAGIANQSEESQEIRLFPDRDLPAVKLLDTLATLKDAGGQNIIIISERAHQ